MRLHFQLKFWWTIENQLHRISMSSCTECSYLFSDAKTFSYVKWKLMVETCVQRTGWLLLDVYDYRVNNVNISNKGLPFLQRKWCLIKVISWVFCQFFMEILYHLLQGRYLLFSINFSFDPSIKFGFELFCSLKL